MAAEVDWYCDVCNPSRQRRSPDMEVSTGYARTPFDTTPPLGWREFGKRPSHACETCLANRPGVVADLDGRRDDVRTVVKGTWPAHASPFGDARG